MKDKIEIKNLNVKSIIGTEKWGKIKLQPVIVTAIIYTDIMTCGMTDLLSDTIDYSEIAKEIIKFSENGNFSCLQEYCIKLIEMAMDKFPIEKLNIKASLPSAYLSADSIDCSVTRTKENKSVIVTEDDVQTINNLKIYTIIGANDCEREEKQELNITVSYPPNFENTYNQLVNTKLIAKDIDQLVEKTRFITIEALASSIANLCLTSNNLQKVKIRVEKPKAILFASASVVEIERNSKDIPKLNKKYALPLKLKCEEAVKDTKLHTAYIALGGNLGNVMKNINSALDKLSEKCKIIKTSFLYETKPMYVIDQPNFLNGACMVYTELEPHDLLKFLKSIEEEVGRTPTIRNGPRVVDLDILFYDDIKLDSEDLIIPHPRIQERRFVLEPLNDIAKDFIHPTRLLPISYLLNVLKHSSNEANNIIKRVMPIRNKFWCWDEKTYLMGILNTTPDSFSDGGKYNTLEKGLEHAKEMCENEVDIIDIGGMSTRPFSDEVSEQEELNRVVPLIKAIREQEWGKEIPISVDTYRAEVAKQAVEAGADLINDVTGGIGDEKMFEVMAETNVPVCLMHMRGTPKTMQTLCQYENNDVVSEIELVLAERIAKAQSLGVKRWNVIVDPGLGFSKDLQQNYQIVNNLRRLVQSSSSSSSSSAPTTQESTSPVTPATAAETTTIASSSLLANFPTLVGPSRKTFIGKTLNETDPKKRVWGTAAVCTALIAENVSILRVHDFKEIRDIIEVSDKMYRK